MSFKIKIILSLIVIQSTLLTILYFTSMSILERSGDSAIIKEGEASLRLFTALSKNSVITYDIETLKSYTDELLTLPEISYVRIFDQHGSEILRNGNEIALEKEFSQDTNAHTVDDGIYDAYLDMREGNSIFGRVEIGIDIEHINVIERTARKKFTLISLLFIFFTLIFSILLGRLFSRKLDELVTAAGSLSSGEMKHRIPVTSKDEFGQVSIAFNRMADSIERSYTEQIKLNKTMFDTSPSGIITIDKQGKVKRFNSAAEHLFRLSAEQVIDRNISELIPEDGGLFHDEHIEYYLGTEVGRAMGQGGIEVQARNGDGKLFPVHVAVGKMEISDEIEFVGIFTDMTSRKATEESLLKKHRAIEECPVSIIITDASGAIEYVNPATLRIYGYTDTKNLVGQNLSILNNLGAPNQYDDIQLALKKGHPWKGELNNLRQDGSSVWVSHHLCPILSQDGQTNNFVCLYDDISELHRYRDNLEEKVKERTKQLELARNAAEAGARAKAIFLANMSHEIRTPMNAIIGFTELISQDSNLSNQSKQFVETILSSARSLLRIINDILDISKLESGKFSIESTAFNLPNAIADAMGTLEKQAEKKGLVLIIKYGIDLPVRVKGDPTRLTQVLLNLVGNAIKFSDSGNIIVSVTHGDEDNEFHFSVSDNGIGMTKEQTLKIFDSFVQSDESTTRRFGGTGLGTTISKQIIERMGGRIWVDSEIGKGSTFNFTTCFSTASSTEPCLYEKKINQLQEFISPRLFNILLAEDLETNATLVKLRLENQGHTIDWAKNGKEVMEKKLSGDYDLILMDVMMPVMDGISATEAIRRREKSTGNRVPIVALTASVLREDHNRCLASGMDRIEGKPIDFNSLFKTMEEVVSEGGGVLNSKLTIAIQEDNNIDFSPIRDFVDYNKALKTWKSPNIYLKALHDFAENRADDAQKLRHWLSEDVNIENAHMVTHALKGVSGNLSITEITNEIVKIDLALKKGEIDCAIDKLPDLQQKLSDVISVIKKLKKIEKNENKPIAPIEKDKIEPVIKELFSVLDQLNPDPAEPLLQNLSEYIPSSDIISVQRAIDSFDFGEAKNNVLQLAKKLDISLG